MKKLLLTLMLMATVTVTLAQSGWNDPDGAYQEQTVVYVTVDCGECDIYSGTTEPQVAAFIDGEIRSLATSYQMLGRYKVYTLRVGGESDDNGKSIDFKLYDPVSGLIYPLEMTNEAGEYADVTYQGDYTYAENQSVILFTGSAIPANEMRVTYYNSDYNSVVLNVGEKMPLDDSAFIEYLFVSPTNGAPTKATTPEVVLKWDLTAHDNAGNQTSYYISIEDGTNVITGNVSTPYAVTAKALAGNLAVDVDVLVYQPVTSMDIADCNVYLGVGRYVPQAVYNAGESVPTTPGFTLTVDNEDVVRIVGGTTIVPVTLGSVTVTAVANDNNDVATKFQVNVVSALEEFYYKGNIEFTIYDEYSKDMTGYVNRPIFHWAIDDTGEPVIKPIEEYTIMSMDPSIVLVEGDDSSSGFTVTAVKKGVTNLVFTSKYDTTQSFEVEVVVKQAVYDVNILTVNDEDVTGAETRPMADVYVDELVTVVAELNPQDADYEDFQIRFVTSDGMEIFGYEDWVEVIGAKVSDGKCIADFIFRMIPAEEVFIQAYVDGMMSGNVLLNVYNRVQSIDVSMQPEYWIGNEAEIFEFKYSVNPDNVKNADFAVKSSAPDMAEIIKDQESGMYQLHAYAPGEVTFTFTSEDNPDIMTEQTIVIKRRPSSVKIVSIAGNVLEDSYKAVQVAVGQEVEAVAMVEPSDATIESFVMSIVDGNGSLVGDAEVEVGEIELNDAKTECRLTFKFVTVPTERVFVKADVNDEVTDQVPLIVIQSVNKIELSENEKTIWFGMGETIDFSITATALPADATNKTILVEVDDNVVVEYLGYDENMGVYNFRTMNKGEATITFTSEDNPTVVETCVVNVKRRVDEILVDGLYEPLYNDGAEREVVVTFMPEDADFDSDALSVRVETSQFSFPGDWNIIEVSDGVTADNTVNYTFVGAALCQTVDVTFEYDAVNVEGATDNITNNMLVSVSERLTLSSGWNWISLTSSSLSVDELSKYLIEARSRTDLVYNDTKWGLFGSLMWMNQDEAYKVKIMDDIEPVTVVPGEGKMSYDGYTDDKYFIKGWNWVSYPYEYNYPVEDIYDAANFAEGDIILSKNNGFVTCTDGIWMGTLTELRPNEGYMIYSANEFNNKMPGRFSLAQGEFISSKAHNAPSRERSVWEYDGSKYANTMAVIARIDIVNHEDYTIGAFVGDECRGEGKFINDLAFISVAGDAGETVTFRLYNRISREFVELDCELEYTGIAGSVKAPVTMGTIEGTTDIIDINTVDSNNIEAIYDLSGRKVEKMTDGIYVIKMREAGKVTTKKVRM